MDKTSLAIVVPFRNEEESLKKSIRSLIKAADDITQLEILLIDDHSTDGSTRIAQELARMYDSISYLEANGEGKKQALAQAIENAKSEWIFTADADCEYPQNSISYLLHAALENERKMACLPVLVQNNGGILSTYQQIESHGIMMITSVALHDRLFYSASGAALLYPKSLFQKLQPYSDNYHLHSGDDQFLLYAFKNTIADPVLFYKNSTQSVQTKSHSKWRDFFRQRLRWAGKNTHLKDYKLSGILSLTMAADFCMFLILLLLFLNSSILFGVLILLLIKMGSEMFALYFACRFWERYNLLKYIPLVVIMHPVVHIIMAFLYTFNRRVLWKDRSINVR